MGGCCVGDCCIGNCGFCCVMDFSSCGDSCCVGYTSTSNDNAEHAKKINEEFNKMKDEYETKAAAQEQMLLAQINESMDHFVEELEKMNNDKHFGRALNVNIDAIKDKRRKLSKNVVGFIGERLHDRIVLTDAELAPILKEKDDKKRNKNVRKFCDDVLAGAKEDLKKQIRETVYAQQKVVKEELENRLKEINESMNQSNKAYEELLDAAEKNDLEKEKLKIEYMYQYDIYGLLSEEMGVYNDIKVGERRNRLQKE